MGVIEELTRQWPSSGKDATIALTATDSFKLCRLYDLAGTTFPAQRVDQRVAAILAAVGFPVGYANAVGGFSPSLYWRLGESAGTTAADSSGNGRNGTYGAGVTLGQTSLLVGDSNTSALFTNVISAAVTSAYSPFVAGSKRTFMGLANRTATTDEDMLFGDGSGAVSLALVSGSNDVRFLGAFNVSWAAAWPGISQTVHWVLTYDDSTQLAELFINGVSQGQKMAAVPMGAATTFQAGRTGASTSPFNGKMDEISVWESILTARQIQAIYYNSTIASTGTFDTDTDTVDAVPTPLSTGSDALSALLALEGSTNGLLIANEDGTMTFQGRHWRLVNARTPTGTFTDDQTAIPYTDNAEYQDTDSRRLSRSRLPNICSTNTRTRRRASQQGCC
jgi:trimeric autotransporter adhesin